MLLALLFFGELFFLFLLSQSLTRSLSFFFYRISKSKKITIYLLAILFLPGTFIHEVAHYLMAIVLFVHAEGLELIPKIQEHGVKLGSVQIEHTDPIRRLFIGMAPFLFGTALLISLLYVSVTQHVYTNYVGIGVLGYAVFEIGNTMFSSRKDMEGALELLIILLVSLLFLYIVGFRLSSFQLDILFATPLSKLLFTQGCLFLAAPIVLDLLIIGILRLLQK